MPRQPAQAVHRSAAATRVPGRTNASQAVPLRESGDSIHILFVGIYNAGPVPAVTGQAWFGLFHTPTGWELAPVRVTVDSTHTPCSPGERETDYYPRVSIDRAEEPLLMLQDVPGLRPGPVRTFLRGEHALYPGQDAGAFTASRDVTVLSAYGSAEFFPKRLNVSDRPAVRDYVLALWSRARDTSQVIFGPSPIFWPPKLAWVGDLDGDGGVDLVVEPSIGQEEPVAPGLWLSSLAVGGELVHRVRGRRTIYCD